MHSIAHPRPAVQAAEESGRIARKALDATHGGPLAAEATFAQRATARVALARGHAADAAKIALHAAARADHAGVPVEAARCRMLAAEALTRSGQRAEAIAELEHAAAQLQHAAAQLQHAAAHGFQPQAGGQLRQLKPPTSRKECSVTSDLSLLSARELQIAELVRAGHTNREIAGAIYVSEKTVERDISRIFIKLGVTSRTALAVRIRAAS